MATGPALEDVALVRDESANLVWGIEQTVRTTTGEGRSGDEMAAESLAFRRRRHPAPAPDAPRAPIAYDVISSVPENWIPFIPVHVPGDTRAVQLQRAAMPSEVDTSLIRPRTADQNENGPGHPLAEHPPRRRPRRTLERPVVRPGGGRVSGFVQHHSAREISSR